MIQGLVGRKLGMTQIFDETGVVHPVTVIECGPNVVTQIRTDEKDGYEAVQLGFGIDKRLNKPSRAIARRAASCRKRCAKFLPKTSRWHRGRSAVQCRCLRYWRTGRCHRHLEGHAVSRAA